MSPATLEAMPRSEKREPQPYERHQSLHEPFTGDEAINEVLEDRADTLEKVLHQAPSENLLLKSSLQTVQERVADPRSTVKQDRLPVLEKYQTQEMNEAVGALTKKLLENPDGTSSLATLIVDTAGRASKEQRNVVKGLGMRMLQLYAPESEKDKRKKFDEGRRQRVRVGEMLILSGQMGDLAAEMQEGARLKIDAAQAHPEVQEKLAAEAEAAMNPQKAQAYYDRFKRYASNYDIPASFRKNLLDTLSLLERQYPELQEVESRKEKRELDEEQRAEVEAKSARANRRWGGAFQEQRQRREAESIPSIPVSAIVEEEPVRSDEPRGLTVEASEVSAMDQAEAEARLAGLTTNREVSPQQAQAAAALEEWREQGIDLGASTLRPVFDRYRAADPAREAARQRYLDIMQNELGYLDSLKEGGLLNKLTSQWTEALYARVAINPTKPWRWFTRRGREDVMQARADAIASLRAGVRDSTSGLDEPHRALFVELANRYEELQVRDQLKARPIREAVAAAVAQEPGEVTRVEAQLAAAERAGRRAEAVERFKERRDVEATVEPNFAEVDVDDPEAVAQYEHQFDEARRQQQIVVGRELQKAKRTWWQRLFGV